MFEQDEEQNILVVSALGPQSAGKSHLLNSLFGTQFLTSFGRCTKGVYCSIINFKCPKTNKQQKILILDTEGIQSAEGRDPKFDKRIVYYILCVSHVILMCNKGEMNAQMAEIIKLAADAIVNTKEQIMKSPAVYIILNQMTEINQQAQIQCVNKLQNELIEQNSKDSINKILKINQDNIGQLPFAFSQTIFGPNFQKKVNKPDHQFQNLLMSLRNKILQKFDDIQSEKASKYSIKDWFNFAYKFWTFAETFYGIIDYTTLIQKKEDELILSQIQIIVEQNYEKYWKEQLKEIIKTKLDSIFDEFKKLQYIEFFLSLNKKISSIVDEIYGDIQQKCIEEYEIYCQQKNISIDLREKRKIFLLNKKDYFKNKCNNFCNDQILKFSIQKSEGVGNAILNKNIKECLKEKDSYSEQDAKQKFEEAWKTMNQSFEEVLKSKNNIEEQVYYRISQEFRIAQINQKNINVVEEQKLLNQLKENDHNEFLKLIKDKIEQQKFVYAGNKIQPNAQKLMEFQEKQKNYIKITKNEIKINKIIQFKKMRNIYKWRLIFDKILNKQLLLEKMLDVLKDQKSYHISQIKTGYDEIQNDKNKEQKKQIQNLIQNLNKGLLKIQVKFKGNVELLYPNDSKNLIFQNEQEYSDYISQHLNQILQNDANFEYVSNVNQQDVLDIYLNSDENNRFNDIYEYIEEQEIPKILDLYQQQYLQGKFILSTFEVYSIDEQFNQILEDNEQSNLQQFINYLLNYGKVNNGISNLNIELAKEELFKFIDFNEIFNDIQQLIIKTCRKDTKFHEKYIQEYIRELKEESEKEQLSKEFCDKINNHIVKSIVQEVKQIIQKLDDELECFSFQFSTSQQQIIYLLAQTYTNYLVEVLEIINEKKPLKQLSKIKKIEQESFIAKLTQNYDKNDEALAQKLANSIYNYKLEQLKNECKSQFKKNMLLRKQNFQKQEQIKNIEKEIQDLAKKTLTQNYKIEQKDQILINEACQFFKEPKILFEKKFEKLFDNTTSTIIFGTQQKFEKSLIEYFKKMKKYFEQFQNLLKQKKANKISSQLFIISQNSEINIKDLNQQEISQYQKKAALKYFLEIINQTWENKKDIIIINENIKISQRPDQNLPIYNDIESIIENKDRQIISNLFNDNDELNNLDMFIQQIIKTLIQNNQRIFIIDSQENQNYSNQLNKSDLIGDLEQQFKIIFMGCGDHCPLCRRQCDIQHDDNEDQKNIQHKCLTGHQIQGFGGNKFYESNHAITFNCNQLQDDDIIVCKGQQFSWKDFQNQFSNWSFVEKQEDIDNFTKKNIQIWNFIGEKICKLYQNEGNQIIFQEANIQKTHYILMLDDSSSMIGQKWNDLMTSVQLFFDQLESNIKLKNFSYISVIQYSYYTKRCFLKKKPSIQLLSQINSRNGILTNFSNAMEDAYKLCQETHQEFQKIVIYFMTDGLAQYPEYEVDKFKKASQFIDKIDFHAVGFGADVDYNILEQFVTNFPRAQLSKAPKANDLIETLKKIIPNIYTNNE